MQKLLVTFGAIAALGFLAYKTLYKTSESSFTDKPVDAAAREPSAPKQTLDNVRTKARSIEANDQAYTDKMAEETKSP